MEDKLKQQLILPVAVVLLIFLYPFPGQMVWLSQEMLPSEIVFTSKGKIDIFRIGDDKFKSNN